MEREGGREGNLPSTGSLRKWSQRPGLGRDETRSQELHPLAGSEYLSQHFRLPRCISKELEQKLVAGHSMLTSSGLTLHTKMPAPS